MVVSPTATEDVSVTEHEGAVLGLIARNQPITRYQLFKAFEQSPTTSYNTSKGSLYPLVGRMLHRGFVSVEPSKNRRGSEALSLTNLGYDALKNWVHGTELQHSFTHDPLLLRVMALGDVSHEDRVRWILDARALLLAKRAELADFHEAGEIPYSEIVNGTAKAITEAKLEWLDRLLVEITNEEKSDAGKTKDQPARRPAT